MKTIYRYLICFLVLGFSSCVDLLDVTPDGRIPIDEIFNTELTTEQFMNSCYEAFPQYGFQWAWITNQPIALSDDGIETWNLGMNPMAKLYGGLASTRQADNALIKHIGGNVKDRMWSSLNSWDLCFRNIQRCNIFLENVATSPLASEELKSRYADEIRILRAYYYMELVMQFGDVPIFKTSVPVDFDYSTLNKNTAREVIEWIVAECRAVIADVNLPWRYQSSNDCMRMSKGVASAIKSRMALFVASPLYNGGENLWAYAAEVTKESLEECKANGYALHTVNGDPGRYATPLQEAICKPYNINGGVPTEYETILASRIAIGWTVNQGHSAPSLTRSLRAGLCPTQELVDAFPMADGSYVVDLANPYTKRVEGSHVFLDPNFESTTYNEADPYAGRDPRFYSTIMYNECDLWKNNLDKYMTLQIYKGGKDELGYGVQVKTHTGYYMAKYRDPMNGKTVISTHWRIFRMNELYLNAAEAAIEVGDAASALEYLRPIRERVGMPAIAATDINRLRLEYRNERRVELAYEEHRYYDLRRWGTVDEDMEIIRYPQAMWTELTNKNGKTYAEKYTHTRVPAGVVYDSATDSYSGTQITKECYTAQYRLHPLELLEAARLEEQTGDRWQNPGW